MYKECSVIRCRAKQDGEFKCRTCATQEKDTVGNNYTYIKLDCQLFETVGKFCCPGDTIRVKGVAVVLAKIWNR